MIHIILHNHSLLFSSIYTNKVSSYKSTLYIHMTIVPMVNVTLVCDYLIPLIRLQVGRSGGILCKCNVQKESKNNMHCSYGNECGVKRAVLTGNSHHCWNQNKVIVYINIINLNFNKLSQIMDAKVCSNR
jgi:hypothetical protein